MSRGGGTSFRLFGGGAGSSSESEGGTTLTFLGFFGAALALAFASLALASLALASLGGSIATSSTSWTVFGLFGTPLGRPRFLATTAGAAGAASTGAASGASLAWVSLPSIGTSSMAIFILYYFYSSMSWKIMEKLMGCP